MNFEHSNGREKKKLAILDKIKRKFSKALIFGLLSLNAGHKEMKIDTFEDKDKAKQELVEIGNTREQKKAYKPIISDLVYRTIKPRMYVPNEKIKEIIPNFISGRELDSNEREDAFRIYLGLNQLYDTFGISDFKPTNSKDNKYYYKINNMFEKRLGHIKKPIENLIWQIERRGSKQFSYDEIMGSYTWTKGEDEKGHYISYYDKWDLDIPIEESGFIGKPFEIYDRIYYNPDTFEPIKTK